MNTGSMNSPYPKRIIIITAPSGSGKTTLVKHLLNRFPSLEFSISACTRPPRSGEQDGRDYYFLSPEEFTKKIGEGAFAEYEMVYEGKFYGTLHSELDRIWSLGRIPLVDIDVRGALALRNAYPDQSLTVFVQPPSLAALEERLKARGTETSVSLEERIRKASLELAYSSRFDRVILNDTLDHAKTRVEEAVRHFLNSRVHSGN